MTIGEFVVKLGFSADTVKVKDFVRSLGDIPLSVASAIGALAGIDFTLFKMTQNALNAAQGFGIFTAQTGLNAKELQRWQLVAKQLGVSEETVTGSVKAIQGALAQIRLGHGELLMPFGRLGVDVRGKNAYQILDQLRGRVGKYSPNVASALLSQIGISPEMMALLRLPPAQFNRMAAAAGGGMTDDQIKAFSDVKTLFTQLGQTIEHDFYPALQAAVPLMKDMAQLLDQMAHGLGKILPGVFKFLDSDPVAAGAKGRNALAGFISNTVRPALADFAFGDVGPRMGGGLNLSQYIYSTASPEEVARHSIAEMNRRNTQVAKQFGNGGY